MIRTRRSTGTVRWCRPSPEICWRSTIWPSSWRTRRVSHGGAATRRTRVQGFRRGPGNRGYARLGTLQAGDTAKALPLLDSAAKSAPANVDILIHAAIVHAFMGNLVQARRYVDAALKADPKVANRTDVKALLGKLVI